MTIQLQHKDTAVIRNAPIGFSWTSLFFGFWVPLLRGDFVWCLLYIILSTVSLGLFWIIFPFIYNKIFLRKLLEKGYNPANESSRRALVDRKIIASDWKARGGAVISPVQSFENQSTMMPPLSKTDVSQVSYSDPVAELAAIVSSTIESRKSAKKAYTAETLPDELRALIPPSFPPINLNAEKLLFAGIYRTRMFFYKPVYGIVITDKNIYHRLSSGFLGFSKVGTVPWSAVNTLEMKHSYTHSCYGGGNPGPELSINGEIAGWIQVIGLMSEDDEKLLIDLVDRINKSGVFMKMPR